MQKYECPNQLTGISEQADTWEAAQQLRSRLRAEYIAAQVDFLFQLTVLVQNEDGSWTQSLADENGNPCINFALQSEEPTDQQNTEPT